MSRRVGDHNGMDAVVGHNSGDLTERRVRCTAEDSMVHAVADADVLKLWGLLSAMGHGCSIAGSRTRGIRGKASPGPSGFPQLRTRETADSRSPEAWCRSSGTRSRPAVVCAGAAVGPFKPN